MLELVKPQVWMLESINPEMAGWRARCALQYSLRRKDFPVGVC